MARMLGVLSLILYGLSVVTVLSVSATDTEAQRGGAASAAQAHPEAAQKENGAGSSSATAATRHSAASAARVALPQMVGMSLNVYHTQNLSLYLDAVDRIAAMGFNTLHVVTPVFQRNGASEDIERLVGPGRALPEGDLVRILARAKARGLRTTLMPQVNFTDPRGNEWRGKIQPKRWPVWWGEYESMISRHAALAQRADVDVFVVGCELLSTQKPAHTKRWRRVIERVKREFDGALTYSTNWDSYQKVDFWDELDAIGISGYWDVTRGASDPKSPTDAELAARWREIRETVLAYAQEQERPVMITELGYPSLPWALRDPWNYVNPDELEADHATQARGYRAFLRGWRGWLTVPASSTGEAVTVQTPRATWRLPHREMAGVMFYSWDPYYEGGPEDTGYGVAGKPAFEVLERWLDGGRVGVAGE